MTSLLLLALLAQSPSPAEIWRAEREREEAVRREAERKHLLYYADRFVDDWNQYASGMARVLSDLQKGIVNVKAWRDADSAYRRLIRNPLWPFPSQGPCQDDRADKPKQ